MSAFQYLSNDTITEIVKYLKYEDLFNLYESQLINDSNINYTRLFYYKNNQLIGKEILYSSKDKRSKWYKYEDLSIIIKDDPIMKMFLPHKILYLMQLALFENYISGMYMKPENYIINLLEKKSLRDIDRGLYELLIKNSNFIDLYNFNYFDTLIYIPYSNIQNFVIIDNQSLSYYNLLPIFYYNNIEDIIRYVKDFNNLWLNIDYLGDDIFDILVSIINDDTENYNMTSIDSKLIIDYLITNIEILMSKFPEMVNIGENVDVPYDIFITGNRQLSKTLLVKILNFIEDHTIIRDHLKTISEYQATNNNIQRDFLVMMKKCIIGSPNKAIKQYINEIDLLLRRL